MITATSLHFSESQNGLAWKEQQGIIWSSFPAQAPSVLLDVKSWKLTFMNKLWVDLHQRFYFKETGQYNCVSYCLISLHSPVKGDRRYTSTWKIFPFRLCCALFYLNIWVVLESECSRTSITNETSGNIWNWIYLMEVSTIKYNLVIFLFHQY